MRAPRPLAAAAASWNDPRFLRHLAGAEGADRPVATLGEAVARAIGARSRIVRLSSETAAKQRRRHPDIRPEDYARVQRILDEGELFREDTRAIIGFAKESGVLWRAVLKVANSGDEIYLVTLHRSKPRNLRRARNRALHIGGE